MITVDRIAGAPITWGVCEVPGWGVMLSADRVLGEMRSLGIAATELGAPGFLPRDPDALVDVLSRNDIQLVGGFVPVVLHDAGRREATLAEARSTAELFAAAGATMFVTAVVVDAGWSPRFELTGAQWQHLVGMLGELDGLCAEYGLTQALHPHVGTLVETAADVATVLERSDVRWCLDTGHLMIGGYDPAKFAVDAADRVVHAHLKDVRGRRRWPASAAATCRSGRAWPPGCSARSARATRRSGRQSTRSKPPATPGGTCWSKTSISARPSRLPARGQWRRLG